MNHEHQVIEIEEWPMREKAMKVAHVITDLPDGSRRYALRFIQYFPPTSTARHAPLTITIPSVLLPDLERVVRGFADAVRATHLVPRRSPRGTAQPVAKEAK